MYKKNSKYRQHFKENCTIDLGAGLRQGGFAKRDPNQIKQRIEANIAKNKKRLLKAQIALERKLRNRKKLAAKIANARNYNYQETCKLLLEDCNKKIRSIENSIERIEEWIMDDKKKLEKYK